MRTIKVYNGTNHVQRIIRDPGALRHEKTGILAPGESATFTFDDDEKANGLVKWLTTYGAVPYIEGDRGPVMSFMDDGPPPMPAEPAREDGK